MKRLFTLTLCAAASLAAAAQQEARISGHLDGIASDTLVISIADKHFRGFERKDTIAMQNGDFDYRIPLGEMRMARLAALPCAAQPEPPVDLDLVFLPGQHGTIHGSLDDCSFGGDRYYRQWNEAYTVICPIDREIRIRTEEILSRLSRGGDQDQLKVELKECQETLGKRRSEAALRFIAAHSDYDASVQLTGCFYEKADFEKVLSLLSERVCNGPMAPMVNSLKEIVTRMNAREEAMKKLIDGGPAPDFTLTDIDGRPFTLSSLRGKYVVLDFWGSWCGWCIKGMPAMKSCYEKHRDRLEIVGVDCNDTPEKWRAAVEKHGLPWLHVYHGQQDRVLLDYAVNSFPTKVIINPDGSINRIVTGETDDFYTYIDSLCQ